MFSILLLFWTAYVLYPLFGSGFIGDDAYNSQITGKNIEQGFSIWQSIYTEVLLWLSSAGRFSPFGWLYTYLIYSFEPIPLTVKLICFSLIYINILLYQKIVKFLTCNERLSYICAFLVPIFFQFREWHDPILSFTFLIPIIVLLLFSSILLLISYIKENKRKTLFLFALTNIIAFLTYELSYIFIFLYLLIILLSPFRRGWLKPIALLVILLTFRILVGLFFHTEEVQYEGTSFNFDIFNIIYSFLMQVIASFPLSWRFATDSNIHSLLSINQFGFGVFFTVAIFIVKEISKLGKTSNKNGSFKNLLTFSFALIILPSVPIAITGHQKELVELGLGYGYIVVFLQYFGIAAFVIWIISKIYILILNKACKKGFSFFSILIVASVGFLIHLENFYIVSKTNEVYKHPRDLMRIAIDKGILDDIKPKDLIIRNRRYPSDQVWFYNMHTNKPLKACNVASWIEFPVCIDRKPYYYPLLYVQYNEEIELSWEEVNNFVIWFNKIKLVNQISTKSNPDYWRNSYNYRKYYFTKYRTDKNEKMRVDKLLEEGKKVNFPIDGFSMDGEMNDFNEWFVKFSAVNAINNNPDYIKHFYNYRDYYFEEYLKNPKEKKRVDEAIYNGIKIDLPSSIYRQDKNIVDKYSIEPFKIFALSYFIAEDLYDSSVILAEIENIVFNDNKVSNIIFKKYKIFSLKSNKVQSYVSNESYDFKKVLHQEGVGRSELVRFDIDEFIFTPYSMILENFHPKEGGVKSYLRWSSGDSRILFFNSSDSPIKARLRLDLLRPGAEKSPAEVLISHNYNERIYSIDKSGLIPVVLDITLNPGSSSMSLKSDSPQLANGDPRNIVFGIHNYELKELVE